MLKLFSRSRFSRRPTTTAAEGCTARDRIGTLRRSLCGPDEPRPAAPVEEGSAAARDARDHYVMVDNFS